MKHWKKMEKYKGSTDYVQKQQHPHAMNALLFVDCVHCNQTTFYDEEKWPFNIRVYEDETVMLDWKPKGNHMTVFRKDELLGMLEEAVEILKGCKRE